MDDVPRASREDCWSSTATIASDAGSGSWDVPSADSDPPRSGILSINGSYAFSCMKLGFLWGGERDEIPCSSLEGKSPTEMKFLMVKSSVREDTFWSWPLSCARRDIISSSAESRMASVLTVCV